MKELTELENPNSVSQLKAWLQEQGVNVASLGKKDVEKFALDYEGTQIGQMMEFRKMLAKSSVKKAKVPEKVKRKHQATSNIIFNLSQMGISLSDAFLIEIDTYFELVDLFMESMGRSESSSREATQTDIDNFLL